MPRDFAQISYRWWRTRPVLGLTIPAQWLYVMLNIDPKLSQAGTLTMHPSSWAALSDHGNVDEINRCLAELEDSLLILTDLSTGELILQNFIIYDGVTKNRQRMVSARKELLALRSNRLVSSIPNHLRELLDAAQLALNPGGPTADALASEWNIGGPPIGHESERIGHGPIRIWNTGDGRC